MPNRTSQAATAKVWSPERIDIVVKGYLYGTVEMPLDSVATTFPQEDAIDTATNSSAGQVLPFFKGSDRLILLGCDFGRRLKGTEGNAV